MWSHSCWLKRCRDRLQPHGLPSVNKSLRVPSGRANLVGIGRRLGRAIVLRYGAKIGINADRLDRVEAFFKRYGPATVAFARFVNVLRQLNGVVAGMLIMEWKRFLIFNALGGALWVSVWTLAGFYLGKHVSDIKVIAHDLEHAGAILGIGVMIAALIYGFWRLRHAS